MASRYLELRDGIIVEVGSPGEKREEKNGRLKKKYKG